MFRAVLAILCLAWTIPNLPAADAAAEPAIAPTPADVPATAPKAAGGMSVTEAVESIVDEDEATRKKALAFLNTCTAADIPALEKFADSTDLEIHRQVHLILQRLKRGEVAFLITCGDGKPQAGVKVTVRLFAGEPQHSQQGKQISFFVQTPVTVNGGLQGVQNVPAQELLQSEFTTDATGKIVVGRFNDGTYTWCVDAGDPLPAQLSVGKVSLTQNTEPTVIKFRRGTTATVTVVDQDNKPIPNAMVADIESITVFRNLRGVPPNQLRFYFNQGISAACDDKGVAVLERVGMSQINLLAVKDGWVPTFKEKVEFEDGKNLAVTLQLTCIKPITEKLICQSHDRKPLVGLRILAVRPTEIGTILGVTWNASVDAKNIDTYVKAGAVDMGTTDDKGLVTHDIQPDTYHLLGFRDGSDTVVITSANFSTNSSAMKMIFEEIVRPKP